MAVWAIGDIQGCNEPFCRLLDAIGFDPAVDVLWLVGDLVNRGTQSLAVLRKVRSLGDRAVTVLGNHDLHLLRCAGNPSMLRRKDTLRPVLDAPDAQELIDWLRRRPLLHEAGAHVMVHAGIHPAWSLTEARALAREVETVLAGSDGLGRLAQMWGDQPARWNGELTGVARWRFAINTFTRMRYLTKDGAMDFDCKLPPEHAPDALHPWFVHRRPDWGSTVVFGHWSALGVRIEPGIVALDSGCVWSRYLTAYCLDNGRLVQVSG